MTRTARKHSETGLYHAMLRGCAGLLIFEDDNDRCYFVNLMSRRLSKFDIEILCWCLMDNHVHILVEDPNDAISNGFHGLATAYARYFNFKTGRRGPLFQDRFESVPIESERQLLNCVRYIHNNPAKAHMAAVDEYRWSSFSEYMGEPRVCSCSRVLDILGSSERFYEFSKSTVPNDYFVITGGRIQDIDALEAATALLDPVRPCDIKTLPRSERDVLLADLKQRGFTIDQLVRITGIGRSIIQRAHKAAA